MTDTARPPANTQTLKDFAELLLYASERLADLMPGHNPVEIAYQIRDAAFELDEKRKRIAELEDELKFADAALASAMSRPILKEFRRRC